MPYKDLEKRRAVVKASMQKKRLDETYKMREREYDQTRRIDPLYQEKRQVYEQARAALPRPFIGIDGEGVTLANGQHNYVLLMASTGERIINTAGLSTVECFEFLLSLAEKYPRSIFCCYGSSYDVTKMLRDIPKEKIKELWNSRDTWNNPTLWHDDKSYKEYSLSYAPRKSFSIRRYGKERVRLKEVHHKDGTVSHEWQANYEASIIIWDSWSFFQTTFVNALEAWFDDALDRETGLVHLSDDLHIDVHAMRTMKGLRNTFTLEQLEQEIMPYCHDEVAALAGLMERLRDTLKKNDIELHRWDGAGAAAAAALAHYNVKDAMRESIPDDRLIDAQRRAYAGGRFEQGQFGTFIGKVFNYDINSAFPFAMLDLPTLTNGLWRRITGRSKRPYSLSRVRWRFDNDLLYYPFFYRDDDGTIYFPPAGEGWYWKPEIDAALKAFANGKLSTDREHGTIEVLESWEFAPATDEKPFAFIRDMFEHRKQLKEEGHPGERIFKFIYTTFYGKTAQSVGGTEENHPTYHNIGYAGYTTAAIRAKIFDAVMQAADSVISINSDGIYSTSPLTLPLGDDLGEWKREILDGIVAVQSGVYWSLTKLDRRPGSEEREDHENYLYYGDVWYRVTTHYRGYGKGELTVQRVLNAWEQMASKTKLTGKEHLKIKTTRFIGPGSALNNPEYWPKLGTWSELERPLHLLPTAKRFYKFPKGNTYRKVQPHRKMYRTWAEQPQSYRYVNSDGSGQLANDLSFPYRPQWARNKPYRTEDGVDSAIVEQEIEESFV